MKIQISISELLKGVYARASLFRASVENAISPARLRLEHDSALRRVALNEWLEIGSRLTPPINVLSIGSEGTAPDGEPEFLVIEFEPESQYATNIPYLFQAALEKRILAAAYAEINPKITQIMYELAEPDIEKIRILSRLRSSIPRIKSYSI